MTSILLVEHNGNIKQTKAKDLSRDILYKKCGFKTAENFDKTTAWSIEYNKEIINIELWAKVEGKANNENKYDFPPPVDNDLYYGTCALLRIDGNGNVIDLTNDVWLKVYDKLFGGFEDIEEEDEEEEDEEEEEEEEDEDEEEEKEDEALKKSAINIKNKTKNGYIKDDFVVDDEEDEEEDNDEEEREYIRSAMKKKNDILNKNRNHKSDDENEIENYGSELEEEAYSY